MVKLFRILFVFFVAVILVTDGKPSKWFRKYTKKLIKRLLKSKKKPPAMNPTMSPSINGVLCPGLFDVCPPLQSCLNGVCVDTCDALNVRCGPGEVCSNGFCIGSCIATTCPIGTACIDGACLTTCGAQVCGLLQECVNDQCVNVANNPCNIADCDALFDSTDPEIATVTNPGSSENGCVADINNEGNGFEPNCCGSTREFFNACASGCPEPTCTDILNPTTEVPLCPAFCRVGCFCKPGYTRVTPNGECIPTFDCLTAISP